eukprot:jgi/Mesvir1/289/Mv13619-RA.1
MGGHGKSTKVRRAHTPQGKREQPRTSLGVEVREKSNPISRVQNTRVGFLVFIDDASRECSGRLNGGDRGSAARQVALYRLSGTDGRTGLLDLSIGLLDGGDEGQRAAGVQEVRRCRCQKGQEPAAFRPRLSDRAQKGCWGQPGGTSQTAATHPCRQGGNANSMWREVGARDQLRQGRLDAFVVALGGQPDLRRKSAPEPVNDARVSAKPQKQTLGLRIMKARNQGQYLSACLEGGPQSIDDKRGVANRNAEDIQPMEALVPAQELGPPCRQGRLWFAALCNGGLKLSGDMAGGAHRDHTQAGEAT